MIRSLFLSLALLMSSQLFSAANVVGCPAHPLSLVQTANLAVQMSTAFAAGKAANSALSNGDFVTYTANMEALGQAAFFVALELAILSESITPIYTNGPTYQACLGASPFWEPLFNDAAAFIVGFQALYAKGLLIFGMNSASSLVKFYAFALSPNPMLGPTVRFLNAIGSSPGVPRYFVGI
jgi:hypothetical protein